MLSSDCTPHEFKKFRRDFNAWMANTFPNGYSERIFYDSLLNKLNSGWQARLCQMPKYSMEAELWDEMDRHMLSLHPLHNRRIHFFNIRPKKDELLSSFLSRIMGEAGIAEMEQITIPSTILHIFCQATPVTEASKPIR